MYSDAAFAPMRAFERRSISGAVLIYRQVTLKCFPRHQHAVSLSSCEAELHCINACLAGWSAGSDRVSTNFGICAEELEAQEGSSGT